MTAADDAAGQPYQRGMEEAYTTVLFHGRHFRGIESVAGLSDRGMVAQLRAADRPEAWMDDALRSNWLADPLVLDSAFQMAILWCFEELGVVSLPACLGRYRQYRNTFPNEGVTATLEVRDRSQHRMVGDFTFTDRAGQIVARLEGYECTADASLSEAFRRRSLGSIRTHS